MYYYYYYYFIVMLNYDCSALISKSSLFLSCIRKHFSNKVEMI